MGGLLGSLPFLAAQGHGSVSTLLSAAQIFGSCLLFGVTLRYVHHADPGNAQLKLGTVAAFGLVSHTSFWVYSGSFVSPQLLMHCLHAHRRVVLRYKIASTVRCTKSTLNIP